MALLAAIVAFVCRAELGPEPCRVRVAQLVQDSQALGPGVTGRPRVGERLVRVAEPGQRDRLAEPVAELAPQAKRPLVAVNRPGGVAEVVMSEAEAVPGLSFADPVAKLLLDGQRLPAQL